MTTAQAVRRALRAEFRQRGLLAARPHPASPTPDLLPRALAACFPEFDLTGRDVDVIFESTEARVRIEQALRFGWVTANILNPAAADDRPHFLSALFNLGIGMLDSFCDAEPPRGAELLSLFGDLDVRSAASGPCTAGRLLRSLPHAVAADPTIAFTTRVIDAFFTLLQSTHAAPARLTIGHLLAEALAAEHQSITRFAPAPNVLLEASRKTSVLPFVIIATLVRGDLEVATHLGEAMWRVDDLADLELDARSGALNSLLIGGPPDHAAIATVAREAAEHLQVGLATSEGLHDFLVFVHRCAGLTTERSPRC